MLHGHSPYPAPDLASVIGQRTFVYPPILLWLDIPLSVVGHNMARALFTVMSVAAVLAAMRILSIDDRRVLACVLLSASTANALVYGNPTILLMPVLAAAWGWRDRPWLSAAAVAIVVAAKPLLWPLGVWLLATQRFRTAMSAVAIAVVALFTTWAAIDFDGMTTYPSLVRLVGDTTAGPRGYSIANLVEALGPTRSVGSAVQTVLGIAMLAYLPLVAQRAAGDIRSFALALAAAFVLSPVVWLHYLALLFVPLAAARPGYDRIWSATRLLWVAPFLPQSAYVVIRDGRTFHSFGHIPSAARIGVVLTFLAGTTAATLRTSAARATIPRAHGAGGVRRGPSEIATG